MTERYSLEQIREFWTKQALDHGQSPVASWSDHRVIEMEVGEILNRLEHGDRVLDVGCANGFSTIQFAAHKQVWVRGLDYIPEMIEHAKRRLNEMDPHFRTRVQFNVGDITALKEQPGSYDKVVVIRVIINLGDWNRQIQGIRECIRVLKPGGLLLLSEATRQGWNQLNRLRREWGLPDIPMPLFNLYVDQEQLTKAVTSELELVEISNFASTYYVGTRVLKPLLIQALGAGHHINAADPEMELNRWCAQLPSAGDYGTQKLFVFKKR